MTRPVIVGINGSPRKYGQASKLLMVAIEYAEREGAKTEIIDLYDYEIKPCMACLSDNIKCCRFPCPLNDDFNIIAEKLIKADGFIISTPIYWYAPSGIVKNFIDRLTSLENMIYHEPGRSLLEGKVAGIIAVGNDTGAIMAIAWLMVVLNSMGVHIPAWALAYHHKEVDVLDNANAINDAANLGANIARLAKIVMNEKAWYKPLAREEVSLIASRLRREMELRESKDKETRLKIAGCK
ncbi:MAG: flavodoxin family protein [Pyrodictiaceae archaeon]